MTGSGSGRGAQRGGQRGAHRGAQRGAQSSSRRSTDEGPLPGAEAGSPRDRDPGPSNRPTELEELYVRPVVARGLPRVGLRGALALAPIVGLLAGGFGVLGGRPSASPTATLAAVPPPSASPTTAQSTEPAAPTPGAGATPLVTPSIECAPPPGAAPSVLLEVNGRPTPGAVELFPLDTGFFPTPVPPSGAPGPVERVDVPVDVITELWIVGGSCAIAWSIELVDVEPLDLVTNPGLSPAYAAQNRFELFLAPYGNLDVGRNADLRATFFFPTLIARATWPIRVLPFDPPNAVLRSADDQIPVIDGCDVIVALGNGFEYPPACRADLPEAPGDVLVVGRDEPIEFELPGWNVMSANVTCGHLSGLSFVAQPEPGCSLEPAGSITSSVVTFPAAFDAGRWTLAISVCALEDAPLAANRICGTWFADVEMLPAR